MKTQDFDFDLPESLIAKEPVEPRDHSRLLVVRKASQEISHHHFFDLPELLLPSDVLVRNTSRVIPARLPATLSTGSKAEIFLLRPLQADDLTQWECLFKPGKKVKALLEVALKDGTTAKVKPNATHWTVELSPSGDFWSWLDRVGEPPLPPYIKREITEKDKDRYQTVYSQESGSVAAPTAGLHFTPELFEKLRTQGNQIADIVLHVGYGTFSPIRVESLEDHQMHEEFFMVPEYTQKTLAAAKKTGQRVIAVGTTSLRTLESYGELGASGLTRLFLRPGSKLQETTGLITNFHLPRSSLFVLVCAILGTELAQRAYQEAIQEKYRFYSYGDAMLILP